MPFVPLLKTKNYFICDAGYVIKISEGKEEIVKARRTPKSKEIHVLVNNTSYNLLHLMIGAFIGEIKVTDRIRHKVDKNLWIPLGSIIIRPALGKKYKMSPLEEKEMYEYKCFEKANSANSRSEQVISAAEVYRVLKMCGKKCVYCQADLAQK